jgi:hypothetical protein
LESNGIPRNLKSGFWVSRVSLVYLVYLVYLV